MDQAIRHQYNQSFSASRYQSFLNEVHRYFDHIPNFRIAETPAFIPPQLKASLIEACQEISATICQSDFKQLTHRAIEDGYRVPNEDEHTTFLQMDFGITKDVEGQLIPKLIEIQGFPSLYMYQDFIANMYRKHFDVPSNCSHLVGVDSEGYHRMLRDIIVGPCDPKNVVLLEIEPDRQTTRIDFLATEKVLGIKILCISDLKKSGKDVYYVDDKGRKIGVQRIYNRVIFDELVTRHDLEREFRFTEEANVEWVGHPNWFFRISKYSLPLFDSQYVPKTWFLKDLSAIPDDLENYVLKPMFSFSGSGVVFNVSREAIEKTNNPTNYILQEKIKYEPIIEAPNEPVKCEIRMLLLWPKDAKEPIIVNNLARLSKGEMIGVKYNKNKDWVGGSVGFFLN